MLLDWGLAELPNVVATWPPVVNTECQSLRVIAGKICQLNILRPTDANRVLNEDERNRIRVFILRYRADILKYALKAPTTWVPRKIRTSQIGAIQLLNVFCPSYPETISAMVASNSFGRMQVGNFDLTNMRGRPILLSNKEMGPYCIIEGTHRLYTAHELLSLQKIEDIQIDVIVGFADDITDCRNRCHREGPR